MQTFLKRHNFLLMAAPMEEHSHYPFRALCHHNGAHLTFTEMVHLKSLLRNNKASLSRLDLYNPPIPTQIQLLVSNPEDLKSFLSTFQPPPGFEGFNLNMGCPSPGVVKAGLGCASIKRITKTQNLIQIFRDFNFPISIKIRLGMNQTEARNKTYLNLIRQTDPDFFILHARHGGQKYGEPADFSVYQECVETGKTIIANGDIGSVKQIKELEAMGIKGVMLGRTACWNPGIFRTLEGEDCPSIEELRKEYALLVSESEGLAEQHLDYLKKCQFSVEDRMGQDRRHVDKNLLI